MKVTSQTVALITGGSSGIGKECSHRILEAGGRVVIVDYDEATGKKTVQEFSQQYSADRVHFIKCDVANDKQLEAAFTETTDKYKRLDIVFNNAGIGEKTQWQEAVMSGSQMPNDWFNTIRIDLDAVINGTRLAVREMLKLNGGKPGGRKGEALGVIINTASVGGLHPMPFSPVYCAAKVRTARTTYSTVHQTTCWLTSCLLCDVANSARRHRVHPIVQGAARSRHPCLSHLPVVR